MTWTLCKKHTIGQFRLMKNETVRWWKTRKPHIFTGLFTWHYHAFIIKTIFHFLNITVIIYTNFPTSNTVYHQIVTILRMYTHIFLLQAVQGKFQVYSTGMLTQTCQVECFTNPCIHFTCPSGERAQNETKGQRSPIKNNWRWLANLLSHTFKGSQSHFNC